jgi:hypothetical protein
MKITDQDIIRTARQLRDEDNQQQHVAPWTHHRHIHIPTWLVAVPAAALVGFLFGLWTNGNTDEHGPLTAMTDTVYIQVKESSTHTETATQPTTQPTPVVTKSSKVMHPRTKKVTGRPISEDQIRYDLLVKN